MSFVSSLHSIHSLFSLSSELMLTQQANQFRLCTNDYITTLYPAQGKFLLLENFLINYVILEFILWEWTL